MQFKMGPEVTLTNMLHNYFLDNQIYYLYHLIFDHCKKSDPPEGDTFSISILGTWVECQLVIFGTFDTMLKDKGKHNSDNANFVTDIDLEILEEKQKTSCFDVNSKLR